MAKSKEFIMREVMSCIIDLGEQIGEFPEDRAVRNKNWEKLAEKITEKIQRNEFK